MIYRLSLKLYHVLGSNRNAIFKIVAITVIVEKFPEWVLLISYFLLACFNNQAGTNSAIFPMLTGLIPLHFDDCLPFSMFTIAGINQTLEKFDLWSSNRIFVF